MSATLPVSYDPATAARQLVCLPIALRPLVLGRLAELVQRRLWTDDYEDGYNAICEVMVQMINGTCVKGVETLLSMLIVRIDTYMSAQRYTFSTAVDGSIVYAPPIAPVPLVDDLNTLYQTQMDIRQEEQLQTPILEEQRTIQQEQRQLLEDIKAALAEDDADLDEILTMLAELGALLA